MIDEILKKNILSLTFKDIEKGNAKVFSCHFWINGIKYMFIVDMWFNEYLFWDGYKMTIEDKEVSNHFANISKQLIA